MTTRRALLLLAAALLLCGNAVPAEKDDLKSGPQAGENLPGPFLCLVTYSDEPDLVGKKMDFIFEHYGQNPVILIFAREMTKPLTRLVKAAGRGSGEEKGGQTKGRRSHAF